MPLFWISCCFFFIGIILAEYGFGLVAALWLALLACIVFIAAFFSAEKSTGVLFFTALVFLSCGVGRAALVSPVHSEILSPYIGKVATLSGTVCQEPDTRESGERPTLCFDVVEGIEVSGRALVVMSRLYEVSYGDHISVRGTFLYPESFGGENGRLFDYPGYLAKDGVGYVLSFAEVLVVDTNARGGIRGWLYAGKQKYLDGLARALSEPYAALAGGITVGDKRALGNTLSDQFQITGLTHIVVLSGYNITLITVAVLALISGFGIRMRFVTGAIIVAAFVAMTGGSATGVRAGAMAVIALFATMVERKYAITRALIFVAAMMAFVNPRIVLHDPSFQLSVLATFGLIHVAPLVERRIQFVTRRIGLREVVAATVGVQLFVLPLILYQMGTLSLVSLATNILVLPVIPVAMIASILGGIVGIFFSGIVAVVAGFPAYTVLAYVLSVVEFFAHLPYAAVTVPAFPFWWVIVVYACMFLLGIGAQQFPSSHSRGTHQRV